MPASPPSIAPASRLLRSAARTAGLVLPLAVLPMVAGCAHVARPATSTASTGSAPSSGSPGNVDATGVAAFTAHYEGAQMGLGLDCVLDEAPPHAAWTAVLTVTDPGGSGFAVGQPLCVVVHSPSMYRSAFVDDAGMLACRGVPGVKPPRFSCDPRQLPTATMPLFDQAFWDRLEAESGAAATPRAPSTHTLAEAAALLDEHVARLTACAPAGNATAALLVATLAQRQATVVLAKNDPTAFLETRDSVEAADAVVLEGLAACP